MKARLEASGDEGVVGGGGGNGAAGAGRARSLLADKASKRGRGRSGAEQLLRSLDEEETWSCPAVERKSENRVSWFGFKTNTARAQNMNMLGKGPPVDSHTLLLPRLEASRRGLASRPIN